MVLAQQVSSLPQEVFPQQVRGFDAQNGLAEVVQHVWPELHELLPQQVFPRVAQNGVAPVLQHVRPELHESLPQHVWLAGAQNGVVPVVQHVWLEKQPGVFPQQLFPLLTQKVRPPNEQGVFPGGHPLGPARGAFCA